MRRAFAAAVAATAALAAPMPQQQHVAYGETTDAMVVQWAAPGVLRDLPKAVLKYAVQGSDAWTELTPQHTAEGPGKYVQYRAELTGLAQNGTAYDYVVGWEGSSEQGPVSHFVSQQRSADWPARLVMFGDIGWTDDQVLPYLRDECAAGAVDMIVIFGDMVYWDNGEHENSFMRDLSSMSGNGSVPVMVSPGNGDYGGNYSRFKLQWTMPGWQDVQSLWHSFNIGRAHVVGIDTEALEHASDVAVKKRMLAWLEADMAAANAPEARAERPWIVVHFHRPAYSTGGTDAVPYEVFEPLMYKYAVDLVFAGHVHNQERTLPVFNKTLMAGPDPTHPYTNANAPVYVVSGNPGNAEETNIFERGFDPWTGWRSYHFGYSHMLVQNTTHLSVDFLSTNLGGQITDSFTMVKDATCNFGEMCSRTAAPAGTAPTSSPATRAARCVAQQWAEDSASEPPAAQISALKDLYTATGGEKWTRNENWLVGNPCSATKPWYGVSCVRITEQTLPSLWNSTGAVAGGITAVHLASNNLRGSIPQGLGEALAGSLQLLDLSSNFLVGALPGSLVRGMPFLHTLYVEPASDSEEFKLTGTLPEDMGLASGLPNLRYLGLTRNALTGKIPESLGSLPCTVTSASPSSVACLFWLSSNNLTGAIPRSLCNATYGEVYVAGNELTCPRPCVHVAYASWPTCSQPCKPC
eukprot:TRINITY_DN39147_c0_g1_i1.p1 TRINITY_DN39147_c0_g1~~TRINITY_DN39147_c0_g1_i1.p1  ORF type:complete len:718 (+),score=191.25 TRINITY_DN39147_c0_g1_i1:78-2156(+)